MRLLFWVTALAVVSIALANNSTAKTKSKRQLENIRSPQNLQYSLVLPHSRVAHFRSLGNSNRRISHGPKGKLPPYAVQMEPVVQYSQKDPLYDPKLDNLEDSVVSKNEIYAQPKILNVQDQSGESFGPPYGTLPTAPLYGHDSHPQYYEAPEPIIEIIIKESNETLPAPPPQPIQKKKKEPVHVFYVKYSKDPHSKDKVIYERPIPAITPSTNDEEDHHDEYVTVTPEPYVVPKTTTLRAIIKPESEVYHSDSSVKVTFGNEGRHYSDRRESSAYSEDHEETAPRPAIALPNEPQSSHPSLERSASPKPQYLESPTKPTLLNPQNYRPGPSAQHAHHAQSRIQYQSQYLTGEQQLPRQGPSVSPFRGQSHIPRNPFAPSNPSASPNPAFANGPPPSITHFGGPTIPTPVGLGPVYPTNFPRPNSGSTFISRPSGAPTFASRPHFNGPPRSSFHTGPQRLPQPQPKPYFDEAKYLQENYHTITTEQVDPSKEQLLPNRQPQNFNHLAQPSPSPTPAQFQDFHSRPQVIPINQQLPQQRPPQHFHESSQNKPLLPVSPSRSPFFNLKPSPPHIEDNRPPFQQHHPNQQQSQESFSFHQGPQPFARPSHQLSQQNVQSPFKFPGPFAPSPSPLPQNQFLPQPSAPTLYNFHPQPSPTPETHFLQQSSPSERPQFSQHGPSEKPSFHQSHGPSEKPNNFHDQTNLQHQQNVGQFVPNGGELVAAISKYEQHITVGPTGEPIYHLGEPNQPSASPSQTEQKQHQQQQQQQQHHQQQHQQHQQQQHQQQHQQQREQQQREQQQREHQQREQQQREHQQREHEQHQERQQHHQQQQQQQQQQQILDEQQQQYFDAEQEQVRAQLAQNVQKQQEEIQRLQAQLLYTQQQQQHQQQQAKQIEQNYKYLQTNYNQQVEATSPRSQYIQERSRLNPTFASSTSSPPYYQSTSRTVEIKPTTQKYVSSTTNTISSTTQEKKDEKKKKPTFELPDEVPDDLRQQLLSSGILDNADISVLDYDKVGDTPLDSLPPDQLANFFSAGGGQQIAASENRPVYVKSNGQQLESRIDEDIMEEDQESAASENVPSYVAAPPSHSQAVEMKVVHFDPKTAAGQNIANEYVQENATQVDPVALNDKKYNRYLPLKVSGNQFPLPDILKGRKVTSVVVLAPVETEVLSDHPRTERAASDSLKGIKFVAGDSLQDLLRKPTTDNFKRWLDVERSTSTDMQSIVLLVTGDSKPTDEKEIYMYDISSGNVNKLSGELSNAFVEAAENNSLSKNIESLAIEGEGIPEHFHKDSKDDVVAEGSENVPSFVDITGLSIDQQNGNQVSIASGYSKTKLGRKLRRH